MKKYELILAILSISASMAVHASIKQEIKLCLTVENNTSPLTFKAGFDSTDQFDFGTFTNLISGGQNCASHVYRHGPKKINAYLDFVGPLQFKDIHLSQAGNCYLKKVSGENTLAFTKQTTHSAFEQWNFTLKQETPEKGYRYHYTLLCNHTSH